MHINHFTCNFNEICDYGLDMTYVIWTELTSDTVYRYSSRKKKVKLKLTDIVLSLVFKLRLVSRLLLAYSSVWRHYS